jgi:hypothetical protein
MRRLAAACELPRFPHGCEVGLNPLRHARD